MTDRIQVGALQVARKLHDFVNEEVLPDTGVASDRFWSGFERVVAEVAPRNRELVAHRQALQQKIYAWHLERRGQELDLPAYKTFLREIGYLEPEGESFSISTQNVDPEIAVVAGPQLVVPVTNARYALNAANARWGSLYDALYGTDAIPEDGGAERRGEYNPVRGARVVAWARSLLSQAVPLSGGSHRKSSGYRIADGRLVVLLEDGTSAVLADPGQLAGFRGPAERPEAVLFVNNGLHIEIVIGPDSLTGRDDPAGIADILLEAAMTTIIDFEDSVATVDAEDKVAAYRNWLGLMKGELTARFEKGGRTIDRHLNPDRTYATPGGSQLTLPGRSLLMVRNVGHLMTSNIVLGADDAPIPSPRRSGLKRPAESTPFPLPPASTAIFSGGHSPSRSASSRREWLTQSTRWASRQVARSAIRRTLRRTPVADRSGNPRM
jgi:malate synthase